MLRIDPNKGNLIKTWSTYGLGGLISIASDTNVILALKSEAKLHEYTSDEGLIRIINLYQGARHAVKLNNGLFVVCHDGFKCCLGTVCLLSVQANTIALGIDEVEILAEFPKKNIKKSIDNWIYPMYLSVNKEGSILGIDELEILAEFGGEQKESIENWLDTMYLSVDKEGSILASVDSDKKAVLLSSNLDKQRILVSEEDGINSP